MSKGRWLRWNRRYTVSRRPASTAPAFVLVVCVATLVGACGVSGTSPGLAGTPSDSTRAPSATATGTPPGPTPTDSAPPKASASPTPTAAATPTNDAMDPSADARPGYVDIVRLGGTGDRCVLTLTMTLAAAPPASTPDVGRLAYRFYLDTAGTGTWDQVASLELQPGGGYVPVLQDRATGARAAGPGYPGTASLAGRIVTLTLPLAALGRPTEVGLQGAAERTAAGVTVRDQAPDAGGLIVPTGCA